MHERLMRVQALRRKREASGAAANEDAWALSVAEQSMLNVVDPDSVLPQDSSPKAAPVGPPAEAPAA